MKTYIDQIGRVVRIKEFPERIISLVPSITELLVDLGLEDRLVGVTKFCVHPSSLISEKVLIGGTKNIESTTIASLQPDLIIASKEENVKDQIDALPFPTWVSDVSSFANAINMISSIGEITATSKRAKMIIDSIALHSSITKKSKVAYLIWRKPYMSIGGDTFIHNMLAKAGFENVFAHQQRYPIITLEDIAAQKPDFIFLSTEPFPFKEKFFNEFEHIAPPVLVDGEMFSWFGSRLKRAGDYFRELNENLELSNPTSEAKE